MGSIQGSYQPVVPGSNSNPSRCKASREGSSSRMQESVMGLLCWTPHFYWNTKHQSSLAACSHKPRFHALGNQASCRQSVGMFPCSSDKKSCTWCQNEPMHSCISRSIGLRALGWWSCLWDYGVPGEVNILCTCAFETCFGHGNKPRSAKPASVCRSMKLVPRRCLPSTISKRTALWPVALMTRWMFPTPAKNST